jgi:anion-transporting  ArsA/GET3 family ATPase
MTEAWIRDLAKRVVEILDKKTEDVRKALDKPQYYAALMQAASEQKVNLTKDRATLRFALDDVKRVAKELLRQKPDQPAVAVPTGPTTRIEYSLPPRDRD